jgi:hypothetical protein
MAMVWAADMKHSSMAGRARLAMMVAEMRTRWMSAKWYLSLEMSQIGQTHRSCLMKAKQDIAALEPEICPFVADQVACPGAQSRGLQAKE